MIVPMYKYSFLIFHRDYEQFLKGLQETGVLHIMQRQEQISEESREMLQLVSRYKETIKYLENRIIEGTTTSTNQEAETILDQVTSLKNEIEKSEQYKLLYKKEIASVEAWGNFDSSLIHSLKQQGISLHFFICSVKQFKEEWKNEYHIEIINQSGSELYFVVLAMPGESVNLDLEEIKMPERSASELEKLVEKLDASIREHEKKLNSLAAASIPVLTSAANHLQGKIDFNIAFESVEKEADEKLIILEGFVPQSKDADLIAFLTKADVLFVKEEKITDEPLKIPVLLKNNSFAKLFEPIGSLFSLPNSKEIDMTPYFAPFFAMFFGFCLGDAGYGLLFIIIATIMKPRMDKKMKPIFTLLQILGSTTVFFGALTGTFFGIKLTELSYMEKFKDYMLNDNQLFSLALKIGVVHIIFAMCLKAANKIKQQGFIYAVSTLGWIILSITLIVFNTVLKDNEALKPVYLGIMIVCGIMILFFANPKVNLLLSFGTGLWDTYSMVTGLLGDILSYIRLFALGISSSILGLVFNNIAMEMSPDIPVLGHLVMVIILLFGHGINIFMSSLGSFVHPMRLTFVEFYKNAGFEGGGKPYKPFKIEK